MAENIDGKQGNNPVLEESISGDGTRAGVFPPGEVNLINMEDSFPGDDEGIVGVFPAGEINPIVDQDDSFSRDDENIAVFPPGGINLIDQDDSFSRDDGIVSIFPAENINSISAENSSSRDDGIIDIFPPGGIIVPISNNNMENSSSFSSDPDDCLSEAGNQTPLVIIPGGIGNDGEPEQSIGNKHPSSEESSPPAQDDIVSESGIVPETRKEPNKRAITKGNPGETQ